MFWIFQAHQDYATIIFIDLLLSVRATEVSITTSSTNVLTDGFLEINCTVVGKPLVGIGLVSWKHSSSGVDVSSNYTTSKVDDFTLLSRLVLNKPSVDYSGTYTCIAGDTTSTSTDIAIAGKLQIKQNLLIRIYNQLI